MAKGGITLTPSAVYGLRSTVALLCVALAGAQEPAPQPRFATKAELVLVDVSVLDRDGRPVADLKAQDFELIARGLSGYYILAFEPTDADRTSSDRRIRVQVRRRDVEVRARSTYALGSKEATPAAPATPREKLNELLASTVDHTVQASLLPLTPDGSVSASDLIVANEAAGGAMRPTPSAMINTDNVAIVLELAGSDTDLLDNAKVTIEIAETALGAAIVKAQPMPRPDRSRRAFGAAVNIAALGDREYSTRAIVSIPGHPDTAITRRFTKVAK